MRATQITKWNTEGSIKAPGSTAVLYGAQIAQGVCGASPP